MSSDPVADDHEPFRLIPWEAKLKLLQVEDRAGQKIQHTLVRASAVKCFLCQKQRIVDSAVVDACTLRHYSWGCKIKCAMLKSVDVVAEDSEKKNFRGSFLEKTLQCSEPDDGVSLAGGRSYTLELVAALCLRRHSPAPTGISRGLLRLEFWNGK